MAYKNINKIAIAGAGTMGASIAQRFAQFGFSVLLYDIDMAAINKAKEMVRLHQETMVKTAELTQADSDALVNRLSYSIDMKDFKDADLIVETIVERIEIKEIFYRQLAEHVKEAAIIVSNTSALPITKLASFTARPERFAGMHWFNPPHIIPLVEVIHGEKTSAECTDLIYALAEFVGKKPVHVRVDAKGFIANRIQFAILREALHIMDEGIATAEDIDRCMKYGLGFRYAIFGPLEIADFGGLDTFHHISSFLNPDLEDRKDVSPTLTQHFEAGELGVKAKKGFYDYANGRDVEQIKKRDELYVKLYDALHREE